MNANLNDNLRKAAVLIRSLDADTAAGLLGQLSAQEAAAIRVAMRELGPVNADERADVLAEFQRRRPMVEAPDADGVELAITSPADLVEPAARGPKRFEFLERAPVEVLVQHLGNEHGQTIAVVLSHLPPARAAAVLGGLPEKLQTETIERLASLGDSDPESLTVLERELADWLARRLDHGGGSKRSGDAVSAILAAADAKTRDGILENLRSRNSALSARISRQRTVVSQQSLDIRRRAEANPAPPTTSHPRVSAPRPQSPGLTPQPHFHFDDLINLDGRALGAVLQQSDPNVLALALAGSRDDLIERICDEMPRRTAKAFRRELRRLGPTRLSDVEAAQRAVAAIAATQLATRRRSVVGAA